MTRESKVKVWAIEPCLAVGGWETVPISLMLASGSVTHRSVPVELDVAVRDPPTSDSSGDTCMQSWWSDPTASAAAAATQRSPKLRIFDRTKTHVLCGHALAQDAASMIGVVEADISRQRFPTGWDPHAAGGPCGQVQVSPRFQPQ